MNVCLVTGASGFVGRHFVDFLTSLSDLVVVAVDLHAPQFTDPSIKCFAADVTDQASMASVFEAANPIVVRTYCANAGRGEAIHMFSQVFHLAGVVDTRCGSRHRNRLWGVNVTGTKV